MRNQLFLFTIGLLLCSAFLPECVRAGEKTLTIPEMTVTTRIVGRVPVDSVRIISAASGKTLYCYTRVSAPDDEEREIYHVWYRNGEKVAEYTLPVRGRRWRTHSRKALEKGMRGAWRVEALDDERNLLKSVEFTTK